MATRTTIRIDDDVIEAARSLARSRGKTIGTVVSELARRGLRPARPGRRRKGFPVFDVPATARPITPEAVRLALEED